MPTPGFLCQVYQMIDNGLLTDRELRPWADYLIMSFDTHPDWLIKLACAGNKLDAMAALAAVAVTAEVNFHCADHRIAALFLRYERREISWATFLESSAQLSDASNDGIWSCEAFYTMLNAFHDAEFAVEVEGAQRTRFVTTYRDGVDRIRSVYDAVRKWRLSDSSQGQLVPAD